MNLSITSHSIKKSQTSLLSRVQISTACNMRACAKQEGQGRLCEQHVCIRVAKFKKNEGNMFKNSSNVSFQKHMPTKESVSTNLKTSTVN